MSKSPLVVVLLVVCGIALGAVPQQWPNPNDQTNAQYRNNPCRDPWISYGYIIASAGTIGAQGVGDAGECNCNLYSNCRWGSFNELVDSIRSYRDTIWRRGIALRAVPQGNGQIRIETLQNGRAIGNIVAAGGGNIIAATGTNIVAAGGGNLQVSGTNPANIVAAGGGNFRGQPGVEDVIDLPNGITILLKKSDAAGDKKDEKK